MRHGRHYAAIPAKVFFHNAKHHCTAQGGNLLILDDAAEAEFIRMHFADRLSICWVGVTNTNSAKAWSPLDGSQAKYLPWGGGEPNRAGWEPYVVFELGSGRLRDRMDGQYPFICEWDE